MNMRVGIVPTICMAIFCTVLLAANITCQESPALPEERITIAYDFPEPCVEETEEIPPSEGAVPVASHYVSVTMKGLHQGSEPGSPVLPFRTARILLPYGFDVERITVTCGNNVTLLGSYMVEPRQEDVPLCDEGPVKVTPVDPDVYGSLAPFPGELYSGDTIQSKMGYRILLVSLHPVQYVPQRGQLSYYESLTVEVTLRAMAAAEDGWQSVRHLAQDESVVREMVDNPEAIPTYYVASPVFRTLSLVSGDYEYVIITNATLEATPGPNNFQALRDEKISRGISATIVTTEWIYAKYPGTRPDGGTDNQTRIRDFIIDAYNTWDTRYVLLAGDGDSADKGNESEEAIIPHRGLSTWIDNNANIAADLYYACLDGSFDYDADGIYGEPYDNRRGGDGPGGGEVDLLAEVYVGRAPVDSQTEVQNLVRKTLAYQTTSATDGNLRKAWMVGEALPNNRWGGDYKDEIKEGSDADGYTTVGFEDSTHAPDFDVSTLYDRDYPGNNWPKSEIIGIINDNAHLVNHCGEGGLNLVMKMKNSDVDQGLTNSELYFIGYSQACYCGAFDDGAGDVHTDTDCIVEHLITGPCGAVAFIANSRLGYSSVQDFDREFWDAVLGEDKLNIGIAYQDCKEDNVGIDPSHWRYSYYTINLFGDPELAIKFHTATGEIEYDSHEIDDSVDGDSDGYAESGETVKMSITLRNTSGTTGFTNVVAKLTTSTIPFVLIIDDSEEYGDIPPGGTATSLDSYEFYVQPPGPIEGTATFTLNITASNGGPWAVSFDVGVMPG